MDLVVTIDTEADNQWDHGVPLATANAAFWEPFMDLCGRNEVRPTFLVSSEVLADERAATSLADWSRAGLAEVGSHLHPWTTPPFRDAPGLKRNDDVHAFPSDLDEGLLRAKLETLTGEISACIGVAPTSFRAGRFGMNATCARVLVDLGYLVDSSVTPFICWSRSYGLSSAAGGPDYRTHRPSPFLIAGLGKGRLLEMPLTIMPTGPGASRHPALVGLGLSLPVRAWQRLTGTRQRLPGPPWMRPDPGMKCRDLERLWLAARRYGLDNVVMMFHSSELMPGGSPYRPTRRSVTALLVLLDEFFTFVRSSGARFPTLSAAARDLLVRPLPTRPL